MSRRRPTPGRLAAAVLAALLTAGCSAPLPEPQPEPAPAIVPASVTAGQVEDILGEVFATLEAADAARDPALLETRVTGPALELRRAQYGRAAAGEEDAITPIPSGAQTVIAPATTSWPRTMMVVTEPPQDLQAPLLLTLVQEGPREQYRLWSWARLFPGAQMPPTARPELGSPTVPLDSQDLLVPPAELVPRYVDVLTNGAASPHAGSFTEGPLRQRVTALSEAYTGLAPDTGSHTVTYAPLDAGPHVVATADGGALVTGAFRGQVTITLADSTLQPGEEITALLGATRVLITSLEISFIGTVAFHVPPAGSEGPVTVLGGEYLPVRATGV